MKAGKDRELAEIINAADYTTSDGIGVVIAAKILGEPIKERVTGIDTAEYTLSLCAKYGYRVFLLGGKEGVAKKAAKKLKLRFKGVNICGTHHGYFVKSGNKNQEVINMINQSSPDVLFVCFGSPMQEKWIAENKEKLISTKLFFGLGGSLDVWSGNIHRAPKVIRLLCLEWLWRITIEPSRISRLFRNVCFILTAISEKYKKSTSSSLKRQ
jgi:N-acetylglucosaminyldiphosphoundecaprenol N-acetyl-beta-D-mannosaminyltransferase